MKLRPMTQGRLVELFFGVFLPGIYWGLPQFNFYRFHFKSLLADAEVLSVFAMYIAIDIWFLSLLFLILVGSGEINLRPVLRWFYLSIGVLTTVFGLFVILTVLEGLARDMVSGHGSNIPWELVLSQVVLGVPPVVWLRYLPALVRGKTT